MNKTCCNKNVHGENCNCWRESLLSICKSLDIYIGFIYDNEESFLEKFGQMNDVWMLIEVSFDSERVKFVYILDSGQHIVNSIKIEELIEWMKELTNKNGGI